MLFPVKVIYHIITRTIPRKIFQLRKAKYLRQEQSCNPAGKYTFSQVSHCYGGNAGDTVLSKCVRMCFGKFLDVKGWNMIFTHDHVSHKTINGINCTDMLIIGGGGLFMRHPASTERLIEGYGISGWQWGLSAENLTNINVPVAVFSCGYNYFRGAKETDLFRQNITELVKRSEFFGLRNHGSIRAIQKILPESLRDKVTFQPCTTTLIRKLYDLPERRDKSGKLVALNMANDQSEARFGQDKEAIIQQVARAIKLIEEKGCKIFYVLHCSGDDFMLPYLSEHNVHFDVKDFTYEMPGKIIEFYDNIDIAIGMRGHAQMIPFGLNTEIISLGTHNKMMYFLEDIDARDWHIELSENPGGLCDVILEKFESIHEKNRSETHERLAFQQKKLWEITQRNMNLLRGLLLR